MSGKIERINCWKTSDGKVFLTEGEAFRHEFGAEKACMKEILEYNMHREGFEVEEALTEIFEKFNLQLKGQ